MDKHQLVGPKFTCPTCRAILVTPPVRSYLLESLVKASGISNGGDEVSRSREKSSVKGKEKVTKERVDWSNFFGERTGRAFSGYNEPEEFWRVGASVSL